MGAELIKTEKGGFGGRRIARFEKRRSFGKGESINWTMGWV